MAHVIRVLDFETTGTEPPAGEVVEVGICDLTRQDDGSWRVGEPVSWLCGVPSIPPETRAVHHISMREVEGRPPFDLFKFAFETARDCVVVAAHNAEFEAKFLADVKGLPPLLCTYKAALRVWPDAPGHSNSVLRYWLEEQGKLSLDHSRAMPPHRAGPDAYVTAHVLRALLAETTGKEMVGWTREPRLLPTCPIGKEWRGKRWAEVDGGFLRWMLDQSDMEADLKWNARRELDRREQARASQEAAADG